MSRIPAWAYLVDGYGEGWLAWMRGFLRTMVPIAGFWIAVKLLGWWWGLLTVPLLVVLPLVVDGLIRNFWPRDHPPSR